MKKILVWLLCVAMVLSLCACGAAKEETAAAETETDANAAYEAALAAYEAALDTLGSKLGAYDVDAVVLTVDGQEITWDVYFYMIYQALNSYVNQMGVLPEDFDMLIDGETTLGQYFKTRAEDYLRYYAATANKAAELGVVTGEEEKAELEAAWQELCDEKGSEAALIEMLTEQGITKNSIFYYATVDALCEPLANAIYGDGSGITNEQAEEWAAANNMVRAKHILRLTQGETEERKAEIRAELEEILAELHALEGDNAALDARFTEIMNEKSEDTGLLMFPDGYVFGTGEMVAEFEAAAFAMEPYALSEIVETSYGYHILLKLPMDTSVVVEYDGEKYTKLWAWVAEDLFAEDRATWATDAELVYTDAFADFTVAGLFA